MTPGPNDPPEGCVQTFDERVDWLSDGGKRDEATVALHLTNVSKTFGRQRVLADVGLEIRSGEIHGLIGQNGSGKSTLVKILAGYHRPDPGANAYIAGEPFPLGSYAAANREGIRFVHQNLGLVDDMSVSDNFWFDRGRNRLKPLGRRTEKAKASAALKLLGYDIDPSSEISSLAASERTAVAIGRALNSDCSVPLLVLDEPTAALPGPEVDRLFAAIRECSSRGTAVLFISHHLDEVLELTHSVTVLRDGRRIATCPTAEATQGALAELMLGRKLAAEIKSKDSPLESRLAPPRLDVRHLTGRKIRDLSLSVGSTEIVGITGLTGSGREEFAHLLCANRNRAGSVEVDGKPVKPGNIGRAIQLGLCMVPSDRRALALLGQLTVRENLTIADLKPFSRFGALNRSGEIDETRTWIASLGIRPGDPEAPVDELSGGNQQKVVMARWLRVKPAVLVLDEPTQGVDVETKQVIHDLLIKMVSAGASAIICSTDADELARVAHRVIVLRRGVIGSELEGGNVTAERIEQEQVMSTPQ